MADDREELVTERFGGRVAGPVRRRRPRACRRGRAAPAQAGRVRRPARGARPALPRARRPRAAAGKAPDHVLLSGPPGLGKTTLAMIIAAELGAPLRVTSGPAIQHAGDLAAVLSSLEEGEVLFLDEIHRLARPAEELLYVAMEDFRVDVDRGQGRGRERDPADAAAVHRRRARPPAPACCRRRCGTGSASPAHLDFYSTDELERVLVRSAGLLGVPLDHAAAAEIASRSRGTPRIANRLLRRVRDWAEVRGDGTLSLVAARSALEVYEVDELGLDRLDRAVLTALCTRFGGGPVGPDDARRGRRRGARDGRDGRRAVPRARGSGRADAARSHRAARGLGAPRARGARTDRAHCSAEPGAAVSRRKPSTDRGPCVPERRWSRPLRLDCGGHTTRSEPYRCGTSSSSLAIALGALLAHVEPYAQAAARGAGVPEQPRPGRRGHDGVGSAGHGRGRRGRRHHARVEPRAATRAGSAPRSRRRSSRRSRRSTTSTTTPTTRTSSTTTDDVVTDADRISRANDDVIDVPDDLSSLPPARKDGDAGHQVDRSVRVTTPGPRPHPPPARPVRAREKNSVGSSYTPSAGLSARSSCSASSSSRCSAPSRRGPSGPTPPGRRTSPSTSRAARRSS